MSYSTAAPRRSLHIGSCRRLLVAGLLLAALAPSAVSPAPVSAATVTVPPGFVVETIASGLVEPTAAAVAPDGRIFVTEQRGTVRLIKNGSLLPTPVVDLRCTSTSTVCVHSAQENGMLSVEVDPNFPAEPYIYVHHVRIERLTSTSVVYNRVSRFTIAGGGAGDVAATDGAGNLIDVQIFAFPPHGGAMHNGGAVHFGPDGKLYISSGDKYGDPQSLQTFAGKMLRLNKDGTIPTDNPYYSPTAADPRLNAIWARGLRNPFTFAVEGAVGPGQPPSRIFINDVGTGLYEEINKGRPGGNYGWRETEGYITDPALLAKYDSPVFAYRQSYDRNVSPPTKFVGCAITGGAFYTPRTTRFPSDYVRDYFWADFCSGYVGRLNYTNVGSETKTADVFARGFSYPVDLDVTPDGDLLVLARGTGSVMRVRFVGMGSTPRIVDGGQPVGQSVQAGQTATFAVTATGSTPLHYQWQRDGVDIVGATAASYTTPPVTEADNGAVFRVIVSNSAGSVTSDPATLHVIVGSAPTPVITLLAASSSIDPTHANDRYQAGDTITVVGAATDPEDGTLPASAFAWEVRFYHNDVNLHYHPFLSDKGKTGFTFLVPDHAHETSPNVWYRVILTVTDSDGQTATTSREIFPRTSALTLATSPQAPGMTVLLEGIPKASPFTSPMIVGLNLTIEAPAIQTSGCDTYAFSRWSDGDTNPRRPIVVGASAATYTAEYTLSSGPSGVNGLCGVYYDNASVTYASPLNFSGPSVLQVDPVINFPEPGVKTAWGNKSPVPGIAPDTFSVRWTGSIEAEFSEEYTFYFLADDGVKLWVNNQLVIDDWRPSGYLERSGRITLQAGQRYSIKIEYFDNYGGATARLLWRSASTPKQVVPSSRLFIR
jgi:glucose/arabinose dehydrogenase